MVDVPVVEVGSSRLERGKALPTENRKVTGSIPVGATKTPVYGGFLLPRQFSDWAGHRDGGPFQGVDEELKPM